jgi:hypothetical protein
MTPVQKNFRPIERAIAMPRKRDDSRSPPRQGNNEGGERFIPDL